MRGVPVAATDATPDDTVMPLTSQPAIHASFANPDKPQSLSISSAARSLGRLVYIACQFRSRSGTFTVHAKVVSAGSFTVHTNLAVDRAVDEVNQKRRSSPSDRPGRRVGQAVGSRTLLLHKLLGTNRVADIISYITLPRLVSITRSHSMQ